MKRIWLSMSVAATYAVACLAARPAPAQTIVDTGSAAFQPGEFTDKDGHKVKAGAVEQVDGESGKAVKLIDEHHGSNKQTVWSRLLVKALHDKFGSEVTLVNPAIGGTTLSQNTVLIPRWATQDPDLVIVWFGGNDWETGVRGPLFARYLLKGTRW